MRPLLMRLVVLRCAPCKGSSISHWYTCLPCSQPCRGLDAQSPSYCRCRTVAFLVQSFHLLAVYRMWEGYSKSHVQLHSTRPLWHAVAAIPATPHAMCRGSPEQSLPGPIVTLCTRSLLANLAPYLALQFVGFPGTAHFPSAAHFVFRSGHGPRSPVRALPGPGGAHGAPGEATGVAGVLARRGLFTDSLLYIQLCPMPTV